MPAPMRTLADTSTTTTSRTRLPPKNLDIASPPWLCHTIHPLAGFPRSPPRLFPHNAARSFRAHAPMVGDRQAIRAGFLVFHDAEFQNRGQVHSANPPL